MIQNFKFRILKAPRKMLLWIGEQKNTRLREGSPFSAAETCSQAQKTAAAETDAMVVFSVKVLADHDTVSDVLAVGCFTAHKTIGFEAGVGWGGVG